MDISEDSSQRFAIGIEQFLEGHPVAYKGCSFWRDRRNGTIHIGSYSDWDIDRSTPEMAKAKIAESKVVASELATKSPEFRALHESLPHQYHFCYDYGNGAVTIAKEVDSNFEWVDK